MAADANVHIDISAVENSLTCYSIDEDRSAEGKYIIKNPHNLACAFKQNNSDRNFKKNKPTS